MYKSAAFDNGYHCIQCHIQQPPLSSIPKPTCEEDESLMDRLMLRRSGKNSVKDRPAISGLPTASRSELLFRMDTQLFMPTEISVKVVDNEVIISGKQHERLDEHGLISRKFTRRYKLPEEIDPDTVEVTYDSQGIIAVVADKLSDKNKQVREVNMKLIRCTTQHNE